MVPRGFVETPLSFRRQHNTPREARTKHSLLLNFPCALLSARLALPFFESNEQSEPAMQAACAAKTASARWEPVTENRHAYLVGNLHQHSEHDRNDDDKHRAGHRGPWV